MISLKLMLHIGNGEQRLFGDHRVVPECNPLECRQRWQSLVILLSISRRAFAHLTSLTYNLPYENAFPFNW